MRKEEFLEIENEQGLNEAVSELSYEINSINSYETMQAMAINEIEQDNLQMAIHILTGIYENGTGKENTDFYNYDRDMGVLEEVTPIEGIEDVEEFFED